MRAAQSPRGEDRGLGIQKPSYRLAGTKEGFIPMEGERRI
jgi:hypothetical protein